MLRPIGVIVTMMLFQAFTFKASAPPRFVPLGTINSGIYTIAFDGPANYCGPVSGLSNLTVFDGTYLFTAVGQTGSICYDSGTGTYDTFGKVKFYDENEELTEIFFEGTLTP